MIKLNLVSPTRGENYTLEDALKKAFQRASIEADNFQIELKYECFYGSKDFYVKVENLHVSDSLWTDSISFAIDGTIPIHTTETGKLEYGFGCGCYKDYGGQFPDNSTESLESWQKNQRYVQEWDGFEIECTLGKEIEIIKSDQISKYDEEHRIVIRLLRDIVQTLVARRFFTSI